jgi:hypothetical protein
MGRPNSGLYFACHVFAFVLYHSESLPRGSHAAEPEIALLWERPHHSQQQLKREKSRPVNVV